MARTDPAPGGIPCWDGAVLPSPFLFDKTLSSADLHFDARGCIILTFPGKGPETEFSTRQTVHHEDIKRDRASWHVAMVAGGIFLSRIAGLIRDRLFAHYFGLTMAADAFRAAFKIPNMLQNLFGEGVLSASFIPVYVRMITSGDEKEANRMAGAIASLLALVVALMVLGGVITAPWLTPLIAPGFTGEKRRLTIHLVQILFPGAGLLVMSAWCLGVLNSHKKFFLSYASPIVWNAVLILTLLIGGRNVDASELAQWLAWGSVVGSGFQVLIQLPTVTRLVRGLHPWAALGSPAVREVIRGFGPVFLGRGAVQLSAYIDTCLASPLAGAVGAIFNAQMIYFLPVSLFGMSFSAAELPAMSAETGPDTKTRLGLRLAENLRRIAFFIVPSMMLFLFLGDIVAGAIFQTGRFSESDTRFVQLCLAGYGVGLLAVTSGRLFASAFYAMRDTRTPLYFALIRVFISAGLGGSVVFGLPHWFHWPHHWLAGLLTLAASLASILECFLLWRALRGRVEWPAHAHILQWRLWVVGLAAVVAGWLLRHVTVSYHPLPRAVFVLGTFGAVYLVGSWWMGIPLVKELIKKCQHRFRRK